MEKLSAAMENYLKIIYNMCGDHTAAHVSAIAARMKLSKASVSRATDILAKKGLVHKDRCYGISLTAEGLKSAALISNKYNIIQSFLNEVLEVDPSVAEKDACSFEHSISLESLRSMNQCLESCQANKNNEENKKIKF
jgi:DtxR family Mn-dependent transcriptional regulator